jgi:hypothetical protein
VLNNDKVLVKQGKSLSFKKKLEGKGLRLKDDMYHYNVVEYYKELE